MTYSAHAVTFCDLYTIDRDVDDRAKEPSSVRQHFRTPIRAFYEVIAYTVAYRELEAFGGTRCRRHHGRATSAFSEASRTYGEDGLGLGPEGAADAN